MRFCTRFLIAAALASPLAASSISYVTALSGIFSGGVQNNYDSVTGLNQNSGSCYVVGTTTGPCAQLSSTPATNTLGLTAASVTIANGFGEDPQNGISSTASSFAYANLATGTVGVLAGGNNCSVPNASGCDAQAYGAGQMQDNVHFSNTTGNTVNIDLYWSFDGVATPRGTSPSSDLESLFCFASGLTCQGLQNSALHVPNAGGQSFKFRDSNGSVTNSLPTVGWVSSSFSIGSNATTESFHGVFAVPAGASTDSLNAYFSASCNIINCDFSHTGAFTMGPLPTGVTFTSDSGVLLSATVPEPGTWTLLVCGGTFLIRRRITSR